MLVGAGLEVEMELEVDCGVDWIGVGGSEHTGVQDAGGWILTDTGTDTDLDACCEICDF